MGEDSLQGYRGRLKVALEAIGAGIGDPFPDWTAIRFGWIS